MGEMAMLTNLGRLLRKIRIDHGEILKNMADKFGVTASYLSAIENGKRPVPESWEKILLTKYTLNSEQKIELQRAIIDSIEFVHVNVSEADFFKKEVAFMFARKVADLPEDKLMEIRKILRGE
jgi:transcriptional regulator with XRE-family HTH domain